MKHSARQIIDNGAGAGGTTLSRESTSTTWGVDTATGGRTGTAGGATTGGTTAGAATAGRDGQKDIVNSKAEEPDRSSCVEGRSGGAAKASVDATDADAWGDPPRDGRGQLGPWMKDGIAEGIPPGKLQVHQCARSPLALDWD